MARAPNEFGPERNDPLRPEPSEDVRGRLPPGGFWPWPALTNATMIETKRARIDLDQTPVKFGMGSARPRPEAAASRRSFEISFSLIPRMTI